MPKLRFSLGLRIMAIVVAALVPVLAALAYNEIDARRGREAEVEGYALTLARQTALELNRVTSGTKAVLDAITSAPVVASQNWRGCEDFLVRVAPKVPQFMSLAVIGLDGLSKCRQDGLHPDINFSDRPYFKQALADPGVLQVTDYTISRIDGRATLPIAMAYTDNAGNVAGVAVASLRLEWLAALIHDRQIAKGGSITVADRNGLILAREPFPERFVGTKIPDTFLNLVNAPNDGSIELTSQDGTRRYLGYVPISMAPTGLYVSVGLARDEAFGEIDAASERVMIIAVCATLLSALAAHLLTRSLIRGPVKKIATTIDARRRGDEVVRTGLRAEDGDLEAVGAALDQYLDEAEEANRRREKAEEHRALLASELAHRLKNQLATVQAIAGQTFRGEGTRQMLTAFKGRLFNFSQAQELLLQQTPAGVTLRATINGAIAIFEGTRGERFDVEGEDFAIQQQASLSIAMAMHELCTNAVKYGALSVPGGRVAITWTQSEGFVWLTWKEKGGPKVEKPATKGFGSKMLEQLLANEIGGDVTVKYDVDGVQCFIGAPVDRIAENAGGSSTAKDLPPMAASPVPPTVS